MTSDPRVVVVLVSAASVDDDLTVHVSGEIVGGKYHGSIDLSTDVAITCAGTTAAGQIVIDWITDRLRTNMLVILITYDNRAEFWASTRGSA